MRVERELNKIGIYSISIDDVEGKSDTIKKCVNIIKKYSKYKNLFFDLNREEGTYLIGDELIRYRENIPRYLGEFGEYESLYDNNKKISERRKKRGVFDSAIHIIASLKNKEQSFRIICEMLGYYLETTIFSSDIDWEAYKNIIRNNNNHDVKYLFENKITDFIFIFRENNDLIIILDHNKYDCEVIYNNILKILDSEI